MAEQEISFSVKDFGRKTKQRLEKKISKILKNKNLLKTKENKTTLVDPPKDDGPEVRH